MSGEHNSDAGEDLATDLTSARCPERASGVIAQTLASARRRERALLQQPGGFACLPVTEEGLLADRSPSGECEHLCPLIVDRDPAHKSAGRDGPKQQQALVSEVDDFLGPDPHLAPFSLASPLKADTLSSRPRTTGSKPSPTSCRGMMNSRSGW
jgi:hypothetical protein